ncbi:hypothetical protein HGP14_01215 [Rhizobium sp. P32RR-XVIII]|uniref:hypothetical protein n=1 Tax=Rhizobium sp. P32RR-XVIII TaxID=2726738 RepID=UPI001456D739|nr:hypothetical protein [Rhizobium sp. P32RR-XVIII]NLS01989.1 hypothetical protein [Rhizobium sp. P32RR-XVIII]
MTSYREWLEGHRAVAEARGGKPIRPPAAEEERRYKRAEAEGREHLRDYRGRRPGEIVNPITGEIATGCLTSAKLANASGMTSPKLTDHMEALGLVHRVLAWKSVSMVCAPELRKPQYYHKPEASRWAVENGYCIPIKITRSIGFETQRLEMLLVTPEGQRYITQRTVKKAGKVGHVVGQLLEQGRSQAEIVELTGYSKQLVNYHTKKLQKAA